MIFHSQRPSKKPRAALAFFAIALCVFASLADAKKLLHNIELTWQPTSKTTAGATNIASGLTVQLGKFGDNRSNKDLIGENREEADEGTVLPVSTVTDVPAWVETHLRELLQQNGVNVVDSGAAVVLDGDVQNFFVTETDNYRANVVLHLRARDAAGNVLWETNLSANEARFGRSYKKENYCETLSNALVSLSHALLGNAQFRDAASGTSLPVNTPVDNGPTAQDPILQ
jgi:hypothetical protein